jgi:competence protein ComGC
VNGQVKIKSADGFTLIEMMIVLFIISTLLLIAVPNMTKSNTIVKEKTCEATIDLLQSQVAAYEMEMGVELNSLGDLESKGYVDTITCPDEELNLVGGEVTIVE